MMFKRIGEQYMFLIEKEYLDRVRFSRNVIKAMLAAEKFRYKSLGDPSFRVFYERKNEAYITHKEVEAKLINVLNKIELAADTYRETVEK